MGLAQAAFGSSSQENVDKVKDMICKSQPGLNTNLSMSNDDVVGRLTDVQGYTGAHRARFDPVTGRGRGLEGRTDRPDNAGYVTGYKIREHMESRLERSSLLEMICPKYELNLISFHFNHKKPSFKQPKAIKFYGT